MRVTNQDKLKAFASKHRKLATPLMCWLAEAKGANWKSEDDIAIKYKGGTFLDGSTVCFVMGNNSVKLTTTVHYQAGTIRIDEVNKSV